MINNNVAILGASPKEDRYANICQKLLLKKGYTAYPVNPSYDIIDNIRCYKSLLDIKKSIDTVTLYLNPLRLQKYWDDILTLAPRRVIFNPGSESSDFYTKLTDNGIIAIEACTLVMLNTDQF